jgi:predicted alpha/beta hydrolase family esterase
MVASIVLPGIGGSDAGHWQSLWQGSEQTWIRMKPTSWDTPDLADWTAALERSVDEAHGPVILIAHSLACLLVVHCARRHRNIVQGAFMVAVPDPSGPKFPREARSFERPPRAPLPFPALIVASTDDAYGSVQYAQDCARVWQTGFVSAGALGHVNGGSGLGEWRQGRDLLEAFCAGACRR